MNLLSMTLLQIMRDHSSYFENIKRASVDDQSTSSGKAVKNHLDFFFCKFYYSLASMLASYINHNGSLCYCFTFWFEQNLLYMENKTNIYFPFPVRQPLWWAIVLWSRASFFFINTGLTKEPLFSVLFINKEHRTIKEQPQRL